MTGMLLPREVPWPGNEGIHGVLYQAVLGSASGTGHVEKNPQETPLGPDGGGAPA